MHVRLEEALLCKFRDQCVMWLIQDNSRFLLGWYGSPLDVCDLTSAVSCFHSTILYCTSLH